jgi:ArsR family transcriptional regulator
MKVVPLVEPCCAPLLRAPLSQGEAEQLAAAFKVVADPARLRLLSLIASKPGGEVCACELVEPLGLSQPTVSHHLKVLYEAGLLDRERRGIWIYYRVVPQRLQVLRDALAAPAAGQPAPPKERRLRNEELAHDQSRGSTPG